MKSNDETVLLRTLFEAGETWGRTHPLYNENDEQEKAEHDKEMQVAIDEFLQTRAGVKQLILQQGIDRKRKR